MYPIRKGIPIPAANTGRPPVYQLADMDVGDNFFVPLPEGKDARDLQNGISRAAKRFPDKKFITRKVTEEGVDGVGCWRVA